MLFLVTVCQEYNHVRSWSVTRFRGMISTQPGSMPLASFKVISLEEYEPSVQYEAGNNIGEWRLLLVVSTHMLGVLQGVKDLSVISWIPTILCGYISI